MALSPGEAASIAQHHGLSLQDAAGLLSLASNVEEAEQIAADFAGPDGQMRAMTRNLFGTKPSAPAPVDPDATPEEQTAAFLTNMFGTRK